MALRVTYGEPGKMNQLMQLMGYDWLSKQRHKRSLDYLQEQRRGQEEYQARGADIAGTAATKKYERDLDLQLNDFLMDAAKFNPIKSAVTKLQYLETQPGVDQAALAQMKQVIGNMAKNYAESTRAILSEPIAKIPNELLGNAVIEAGPEELGRLARAGVTRETEEARLGVSRERLKLEKRKEIRLGKEKPSELLETQNKEWITLIKDTVDFLESRGVEGSELDKEVRALFSTGKYADPLSPELQGKAYTYLMEIWMKLIKRKPLREGDELFLQKIRNTRGIVTPVEEGGYGGLPPRATPEEIAGMEAGFPEQVAMPAAEPVVSDEERGATLTRMILEEAAMANKEISPEEAERRARAALGIG